MKFHCPVLLVFTLGCRAKAHFLFGRLILDERWSKTWEYVREVSPVDHPSWSLNGRLVSPIIDLDSTDMRCGRNATVAWSKPKVAVVQAGATVGFALGEPKIDAYPEARIQHAGPASVWMSKAPNDDINAYQGDGDWFKILQIIGRTEQSLDWSLPEYKGMGEPGMQGQWGSYQMPSWNFTIPTTTPPGKYLLRWESSYPHVIDTQFFVNCAHVEVKNDGPVGTPSPAVKIPGVYRRGQPDVYLDTLNQTFFERKGDLSWFIPPYPPVWTDNRAK